MTSLSTSLQHLNRTLNLAVSPDRSEIYKDLNSQQVKNLFFDLNVTNDISYGYLFESFIDVAAVSNNFFIIGTYLEEYTNLNSQYISMIRGIDFPFYGYVFALQKQIANYYPVRDPFYDLSAISALHAQLFSYLF